MVFGVRSFELALMHRMRDLNPARVEDALADMAATRAELREAHALWTRTAYAARAPKGVGRFRMALGRPTFEGERPIGSLTCDVVRWALPYWRGVEFELLVGPGGEIWNQWFVRPSGDRTVSFADLVPWECVVADIGASFPDAVQEEGTAPHHWAVSFQHSGTPYRARFVYGLLQSVDPR